MDWQSTMAGLAGGAGAGFLASSFNSPKFQNPADAGMPYLKNIPGAVSPYYNPYMQAGQGAMSDLQGQYKDLLNDPGSINARLGAGYKQSPGYQFKLSQAMMAGDNAAAAGGMAGSPLHQQANMTTANGIASQDYNDYMTRMQNLYGEGLHGEQGMMDQGYNASNEMGQSVGNMYNSEANLAAQGANQQNQYNQAKSKANSDMFGSAMGFGAQALPWLMM